MTNNSPWGFESDETSSGQMFTVYDSRGVCLTDAYIGKDEARLIAAAPDLLRELQDVLKWTLVEKAPLRDQEIRSIRATIDAATGANHEQ